MDDYNNIGTIFVQRVSDNFKDFAEIRNNVRDLNVEYEYNEKRRLHIWSVWIELKYSQNISSEYGTSISMTDSEFGKTKFKTVEEVETVIAEAIKDYVYGV